jgi:hypothetical protein
LITVARELFHAEEYHDTGTEDIVARAAVGTRGTLSTASQTRRTGSRLSSSCRARLLGAAWGGVQAFVRGSPDPEVQRVILIDGPGVLGWDEWREIEAQYGLGAIEAAIGAGPSGVNRRVTSHTS